METVSSCPFCGCRRPPVASNLCRKNGIIVPEKYFVQCPDVGCGARGPAHDTYEAAEAAWNKRAVSASTEQT